MRIRTKFSSAVRLLTDSSVATHTALLSEQMVAMGAFCFDARRPSFQGEHHAQAYDRDLSKMADVTSKKLTLRFMWALLLGLSRSFEF